MTQGEAVVAILYKIMGEKLSSKRNRPRREWENMFGVNMVKHDWLKKLLWKPSLQTMKIHHEKNIATGTHSEVKYIFKFVWQKMLPFKDNVHQYNKNLSLNIKNNLVNVKFELGL